ncbi:MAG: MetQ/NlpA family ABC transporter substrate-binding protein [Bifidobacterium sp.]|jgi:D-methionine transport system substrate-binding protein|nr:MetQ/NlpA family ABC transporter substrate-binding protein [Bifidobacterium sp.]MCI1865647.1 MetQ/NlpA family ABC transporter substrate-binding protein [Bifidobacterium sp.]
MIGARHNHTKRKLTAAAAALASLLVATGLSACSGGAAAGGDTLKKSGSSAAVVVGVCPGPYGDMVTEVIAPLLKDKGYRVTTKLFNDYVQPNKALSSGSIQADLFQHINYLNTFAADNHLALTSLGQVPTLGLGIYSHRYTKLSQIPEGATVAIASDPSNLARSLEVLRQNRLITIKSGVQDTKATVDDIASNPRKLAIKTLDAAQLPRSLDSVDVSLIPGNFSWSAGLKPSQALAFERQSSGVINVFVVRTADVHTSFARDVKALLASNRFKQAIATSKFADFGKPTTWQS